MFYKSLHILIIVLLLTGAAVSFAQNRAVIGGQAVTQFTTEFSQARGGFMAFLNWLFPFMIAAAVIIATLSIIYAGFEWMAGAISPPQIEQAKNRIYAAILGLAVALGSWLILNTISPTFTKPKAPVGFTLECQNGVCPSWTEVLFGSTESSYQPTTNMSETQKNALAQGVVGLPNSNKTVTGDAFKVWQEREKIKNDLARRGILSGNEVQKELDKKTAAYDKNCIEILKGTPKNSPLNDFKATRVCETNKQ